MAEGKPQFRDFDRRLWLSGGRDQIPEAAMRRCVGAARELTHSVSSRYGSQKLYNIAANSLFRYNQHRYQFDGSTLFQDGVAIDAGGYNGQRMTFVKMPPQIGLPDYLFLTGAGKQLKIAPDGTKTNWGIQPPPGGFTAINAGDDSKLISTFNFESNQWNLQQNIFRVVKQDGPQGGLELFFSGASAWSITKNMNLDLSRYADGVLSLQSDSILFGCSIGGGFTQYSMFVDFDVGDGTFNDMYRCLVGFTSNPALYGSVTPDFIIDLSPNLSTNIFIPKSKFKRVGGNGNGWESVRALRFVGGAQSLNAADYGNPPNTATNFGSAFNFLRYELHGGYPLTGNYKYFVTYLNSITGSRSNPNANPVEAFGLQNGRVVLNNLPISPDPQVSAREIWRTTGNGETYFLDGVVPDNATQTYIDQIADVNGIQFTANVWMPNHLYADGTLVDGNNGYYFLAIGTGFSGGGIPPWNIPNATWVSLGAAYQINDRIVPFNHNPNRYSFFITNIDPNNPKTGAIEPDWSSVPLNGTIVDGGITWKNDGGLFTTDGTRPWKFQGINSLPALQSTQLPLDNAPPMPSYNDAVGPFQGSMFWCRDSTVGARGRVYFSPPGRPESVGGFVDVSNDDDPTQKLVIWDSFLWLFTTKGVFQIKGEYPSFSAVPFLGVRGTTLPFAIVVMDRGIVYQGEDGIRLIDHSESNLVGFENIAPILHGQAAENVTPFTAVIGARAHDEVFFSDGNVMFALLWQNGQWSWRMVNLGFNAIYQEQDTGEIVSSFGGKVYLYEHIGLFADDGTPITVEWQSPSIQLSEDSVVQVKRVFLDINLAEQVATPTFLLDGVEYPLPNITNSARSVIEIPWQKTGRLFGIRLNSNITRRIEWFGAEPEIHVGADQ